VAQPRQRHGVVAGHVRNYIPSEHPVHAFKASVRLAASEAYAGPPLESPLRIRLLFVMPRPASRIWKKRPMPREPYIGRCDWDNLAKAACDALNGTLWRDDRQIWHADVTAVTAAGDEASHAEIEVHETEVTP
jgi:Holliday junction resolvase RusA-like endonuclease